jgi:hypothetical protein
MTKEEALKLARSCILASLEYKQGKATAVDAVEDINEALAQPEQEPVAWGYRDRNGEITDCITPHEHDRAEGDYRIPLYTAPPAAQRKPLTLEDAAFKDYLKDCDEHAINPDVGSAFHFAWQAAHGIKENT